MGRVTDEGRALRVRQAIQHCAATQSKIAEYCDVTVQSVGGWQKTGAISDQNLRRLSEVTGFGYLWLRDGRVGETLSDSAMTAEDFLGPLLAGTPEADRFLRTLRLAAANGRISTRSLSLLADFLESMVNYE